jgi:glutaredoxin 3
MLSRADCLKGQSVSQTAAKTTVRDFPVKIRLFIKDPCGWCVRAMHWLDARGISYETINVSADRKAFDEMVRLSGQSFAPVIEVDGKILADFGPEELAVFWETISPARKAS